MERINTDMIRERSMEKKHKNEKIVYMDSNIIIINSVQEMMVRQKNAALIDGYLLLLVLSGDAIINIENKTINLTAGDVFLCTPRNIIENGMTSVNFELQGCFVSSSYAQQIMRDLNFNISFYGIRKNHRVAHLSKEDIDAMKAYHKLLAHMFRKPETELRNFSINHMMQLCAVEFYSMFKNEEDDKSGIPICYSSADQLVNRFAQILNEANPPIHSVNEVAEQLNVSPKYFSTICKQVTGHTASEIIIEQLVNTAKIMLRNPQMSIKQIATRMGFNNQSHFGTFMRRNTGMSPQQLRKTSIEKFKKISDNV